MEEDIYISEQERCEFKYQHLYRTLTKKLTPDELALLMWYMGNESLSREKFYDWLKLWYGGSIYTEVMREENKL